MPEPFVRAEKRKLRQLPAEGLEPTRPCGHWILSPARLPIPPRRRKERSETIRDSHVSSTSPLCRVRCPQRASLGGAKESAEDSGHYTRSGACKPRGGPKISRRRIASRKPDL